MTLEKLGLYAQRRHLPLLSACAVIFYSEIIFAIARSSTAPSGDINIPAIVHGEVPSAFFERAVGHALEHPRPEDVAAGIKLGDEWIPAAGIRRSGAPESSERSATVHRT